MRYSEINLPELIDVHGQYSANANTTVFEEKVKTRKFNSLKKNPKFGVFDPDFLEVDFEAEKLQMGLNASI